VKRFNEKANDIFRIPSAEHLNNEVLLSFVKRFVNEQLPRLKKLRAYYLNDAEINYREARDSTRADNRLAHNFARYISTVAQGYLLGKPITYNHENEAVLEQINTFNDMNNEQSHNALLGLDLSIYGRAFEMFYTDEESQERLAVSDPTETFVIYDTTVQMKPIAAVRLYSLVIGEEVQVFVEKYTATHTTFYTSNKDYSELSQTDEKQHFFGAVSISEYWNNDHRLGDFETALDQIDAYNISQSDTANGQEDHADAYLVLQGQPNTDSDDVQKMKEARVIALDDAPEGQSAAAYYLVKSYDVAGQEAYKNRLVNDIHKLTFIPDLSDEKFSSNVSGEAMKYKLFVFDQLRATKERLFKEGIMARYRIVGRMWSIKNKDTAGIEKLEIAFTPNLPANVTELIDNVVKLDGVVSDETRLAMLPVVEDVGAELERIKQEKEEAMKEFQMQPVLQQGVSAGE